MFNGMHGRGCGPRGGRGRGAFAAAWAMYGAQGRGDPREARGGGRGRRMFDGGELRLVLLKLIADEPRHGYELIRAIEEMTGGGYAPSPGIVYPTLTLLDEMGLTREQVSEGAKKCFAATDEGRAHLAEHRETVDALLVRLAEVGAHRGRTDNAPIRRAMGNLHQALRDRLGRGDVAEDTLHDVVALIDEVAQKIERLK